MKTLIDRRRLMLGAASTLVASSLQGCNPSSRGDDISGLARRARLSLPLVSMDRVTAVTVCSRPFRTQGPRLEAEQIGQQTVVHHYGHGGSGWSLSWGSAALAAEKVMATGVLDVGVIGCGAIGLTTGLQLQRMGAQVTIYAKHLPPDVRSSLATGVWSPDSRICLEDHATPAFKEQWERMARISWQKFQSLLGLPGDPVEFVDRYALSDEPPADRLRGPRADGRPGFAELDSELIPELQTEAVSVAPGNHPFVAPYVRRTTRMMFNLPAYARMLMADFRINGGRIVIDELHSPADFARLPHRTLVNATGFGARALLGDHSIVPVRGQLTHLIPQPEVRYGLQYHRVSLTPRRDGLVLQVSGEDDYAGYDNPDTTPDKAEAEHAVRTIARAFKTA